MKNKIEDVVHHGMQRWIHCFESIDAFGCASCYEPGATVIADPFGTFRGREAIAEFWDDLAQDGYNDLRFIRRDLTIIDDKTASCTGLWTMRKAYGALINQVWVIQTDGKALIREDHFEIQGWLSGDAQERTRVETMLRSDTPGTDSSKKMQSTFFRSSVYTARGLTPSQTL